MQARGSHVLPAAHAEAQFLLARDRMSPRTLSRTRASERLSSGAQRRISNFFRDSRLSLAAPKKKRCARIANQALLSLREEALTPTFVLLEEPT
jgi:hypothetical protein